MTSTAALRVRAIGSSPSVQRPGQACSSYLLRTQSTAVALDLGSGALGNLQLALDYPALDAVVITHMHADHFLDLLPLRYGLTYGPLLRDARMPLWLPPGGSHKLRMLCATFSGEGSSDFLDGVFAVNEYDPACAMTVNDLRLTFRPTLHYVDSFSIRAACGTASVVYSGDTAPCDEVVDHARACALFICEATLGLGSEPPPRGHSSAEEAGEMALRAGVGRLGLTHYYANADTQALVDAAQARFPGPVTAISDGEEFSL
ncbi:MAG: MBL fold metallo-hydrolase [Candidatus Tumulicola sp.]